MLTWIISGSLVVLTAVLALRQLMARRFCQRLVMLHEALGAERDPADLARRYLAAAVESTGAEAGLLYCLQDGMTALRLRAAHGLSQEQLAEATIDHELRLSLLGEEDGPGARKAVLLRPRPGGFLGKYSHVLSLQLQQPERLVGRILLLRTTGVFSRRDLALMDRFASRAAEGVENARLFQQHKNAAEENARLYLNLSRLYRQATVDNLTGLHNRGYMQQRLKEEIKKAWRFRQALTVVLLDIDLFHRINESRGQKAGDEALRDVAKLIRKTARDYDVVCRYGGEEFLLILPQTNLGGAVTLAERLRREIAEQIFPEGLRLTCSLGVAELDDGGALPPNGSRRGQESVLARTLEDLLAQAEMAVVQAKEVGRNRVEVAMAVEDGRAGPAG